MSDEIVRCPYGGTCNACVDANHCRANVTEKGKRRLESILEQQKEMGEPKITVAGALKYDTSKVDLSLIPIGPLMQVAAVWDFGKKKYAAYNWTKGFVWSRPYAAALRHIFAWAAGEDKDPESGLPHLAHAICCLTMLLEFQEVGTGEDDRYKRATKI